MQVDLVLDPVLAPAQLPEHFAAHVRAMEDEFFSGFDLCPVGTVRQRFLEYGALVGARECRMRFRSGRIREPPSAPYRADLADRVAE